MKAIFLDRDGTLNTEPEDEVVDSPDKVWLYDGVLEGLQLLAGLDYAIFITSNQIGIARKRITVEQFNTINQKVMDLIAPSGIKITKAYVCPHEPADNCVCRKPKPGMIKQALADFPEIDLHSSWVIGDRLSDVGLASAVKCRMILIDQAGKYAPETADFVVRDFLDAAHIVQNGG